MHAIWGSGINVYMLDKVHLKFGKLILIINASNPNYMI